MAANFRQHTCRKLLTTMQHRQRIQSSATKSTRLFEAIALPKPKDWYTFQTLGENMTVPDCGPSRTWPSTSACRTKEPEESGRRHVQISSSCSRRELCDIINGIHAEERNHSGYKKVLDYVQCHYFGIICGLFRNTANIAQYANWVSRKLQDIASPWSRRTS